MMNQKVRKVLAPLAVGALACSLAVATPMAANAALTPGDGGSVERVTGIDRFQTAVNASKAFDSTRGNTVIIAGADAWADVIAATPLAAKLKANILYTGASSLNSRTEAELKRLNKLVNTVDNPATPDVNEQRNKVTNVIIIGGTGAVSDAVRAEIEGLKDGGVALNLNVQRIGGGDRYETALLVAAETVNAYDSSTAIATARKNLEDNTKNLNAVANANAGVAKAAAALPVALNAWINAQVALTTAQTQLGTLQASLTPAIGGEAALNALKELRKTQLQKVKDEYALLTALLTDPLDDNGTPGDTTDDETQAQRDAKVVTKQGHIVLAQDALALTDKQISDATAGIAENAPIEAQITALKKTIGVAYSDNGTPADLTDDTAATGLYEKIDDAKGDYDDADAALTAAQVKVTGQTTPTVVRPAAEIQAEAVDNAAGLQKAYDAAVTAAITAGAKYPAFLATGGNFADALAAGPAAAQGYDSNNDSTKEFGVVLLTNGSSVPASTQRYLNNEAAVVTVGGAAAAAVPGADKSFVGADRYATAVAVANAYQETGKQVAVTSGASAADAVVAGAVIAADKGTVVLTAPSALPTATRNFLSFDNKGEGVVVFGGTGAVSNSVFAEIKTILG